MAAKKELYWLGVGVKTVDGKDYGAEMPLPVDKIDKDDLKKMIKDGRIGERIAIVPVGCGDCTAHLETIEAKNAIIGKLKETAKELAGNDSTKELAELKDDIEKLESEVEKLTCEAEEAAELKAAHVKAHADNPGPDVAAIESDNEEKAALIKDQKADIKALKKELKDEVARLTSELDEATKPAGEAK